MATPKKLKSEILRSAALEIATAAGRELKRIPVRQLLYETPSGETVRLRTNNDRCLMTATSSVDRDRAKLDIDGTDFVLFGVPVEKRGTDLVEAYLVPTQVAVTAIKDSHKAWLEAGGSTKGANRTWAIWLDKSVPTSDMYAEKWHAYRLGQLEITTS